MNNFFFHTNLEVDKYSVRNTRNLKTIGNAVIRLLIYTIGAVTVSKGGIFEKAAGP